MWFNIVVSSWIYASTIVSTLRAGSRVWYMLANNGRMGRMEGPLITSSSGVYQSTLGFRHAVSLANDYKPSNQNNILSPTLLTNAQDEEESALHQQLTTNKQNHHPHYLGYPIQLIQNAKKGTQWWFQEISHLFSLTKNKKQPTYVEEEELDYNISLSSTFTIPTYNSTSTRLEVTCFAPKVFAKLRQQFGISHSQFIQSLLRSGPYVSFQSNSKGAARSGGFFFFTSDGAYMIKTIKKAEVSTFFNMLPKYYTYMKKNARRSLLTRFFGIYSVRTLPSDDDYHLGVTSTPTEEEQYFVIMNAVFPAEGSKFISTRFDLKGSTVGRKCSEEEKMEKKTHAVLKDLDLNQNDIVIGAHQKSDMLSQLRNDVGLLVECGVMDYSLLVGIVNLDQRMDISEELLSLPPKQSRRYQSLLPPILRIDSPKRKWLRTLGRVFFSLPYYICTHVIYGTMERTISSVITLPLPYYGAGKCGVDAGQLAMMNGKTTDNQRAIFYLGIIDFLQPWTSQKVVENHLKGLVGYDKNAISCVHPDIYAQRFLQFLQTHIN